MRASRLGDVVTSMKNGIYKPATEYANDGMPCLRMYNIEAGSIVWRDIKRMRINEREFAEYGLREGDLLVNRVNSRELVGKAACIPARLEPSVFESKNIRVRLDRAKVIPKFINFQLFANGSRHFANNAQQVVGMASISQGQLADFPIVLTDIDRQRLIVSELEKQFSRLNEAVANLRRVKANLRHYRVAVLRAATLGELFGDFETTGDPGSELPSLPAGWCWSTADTAIDGFDAGASFKCIERPPETGEVGVLKVSAVTWGVYDEAESKTCVDPSRVNPRFVVRSGDFLFSRANTIDLVGACVIVGNTTKQLMLSDKTLRFRINPRVSPCWLQCCLRSQLGRAEIERLATGNQQSMRNIGQERIRQIRIPLPPLAEQHRIVAEVDRRLSIVREVEAEIDSNLMRAQALRQAVLAKAFGKRSTTN